jgi:rhodanese-related sulfurtransferase
MVERITPVELRARLAQPQPPVLLDVRESEELAICRLERVTHIPLGELAVRARELDPSRPLVCICHHGMRSANAAAYLERLGFEHVANLQGGMERWALDVDPAMARY